MPMRVSRPLVIALLAAFAAALLPLLSLPLPEARAGDADMAHAPDASRTIANLRANTAVLPPALPVHPTRALYNREAIVPPQCYTRTEGRFNPCYVCHQDELPGRENRMNDRDLQAAYSFSEIAARNPKFLEHFDERRQ